jgi:hypothetical protein
MRLAADFVGKLMGQMLLALMAMTRRLAANAAHAYQAGGQKRLGGCQTFELAAEHAADVAGMTADVHGNLCALPVSMLAYRRIGRKAMVRTKRLDRSAVTSPKMVYAADLRRSSGARKSYSSQLD